MIHGGDAISGGMGGAGGDIILAPGNGGVTNGRVGVSLIGVFTPSALFDVNGEARAMQMTTDLLTTKDPSVPLQILGPGNVGTGPGGSVGIRAGDASGAITSLPGAVTIGGGDATGLGGEGGHVILLPGNGTSPGSVGINTNDPDSDSDLHLLGRNDHATIRIENPDSNGPSSPATLVLRATALDLDASWSIRTGHEDPGAQFASNLEFLNENNAESTLVLRRDGNVGVGVTEPTKILTIKQNSMTDPVADAWTVYSSRRWKTNIDTLENALERVRRLRGVSFDWKADGRHDIGLIAEEVGEVVPEVVAYEPDGTDASAVDYARLVALLIEAVKDQQAQIDELKEMIRKRR